MNKKRNNKKPESRANVVVDRVLHFLKKAPSHTYNGKQISRKLNLRGKKSIQVIEKILVDLCAQGLIEERQPGDYGVPFSHADAVVGKLDYVSPRFGFVAIEGTDEEVKLSAKDIKDAMHGDIVEVGLYPNSRGAKKEGEVLKVLERGTDTFVGRLQINKGFAFLIPDSKRVHTDIYVHQIEKIREFDGYKVVVKVDRWPEKDRKPEGKVIRVLGKAGEHETEMHAILEEYGLPTTFPADVEKYVEAIPETIPEKEIAKRRDFRDVTTFTIDPLDAKDFDDAISIKELPNGHYEIGIHIADVTHYLIEGSVLDKEAYKRATSVYLVDRVVPMLPEKLSNNMCSLRPHEDRLAFSSVFEIDENAAISKEWYGRTVIHSDRRFTYEEAQEVIETGEGDFAKEILKLNEIAYKLRKTKFDNGAIAFETPEVKFKLDEKGKPLEVVPKIRKDAHKLVEDFMLLANRKVATKIVKSKSSKNEHTFVYRIHEPPDPEKMNSFANFAARFGYKLDLEQNELANSINNMVVELENKPECDILQNLAVRAMSKARYTTAEKGHFGLAFDHYTHFTSPIRRYPDVMVHRLLQRYLDKGESADKEEYEDMCLHSSDREKNAANAERASIKYKQVEFMQGVDPDLELAGIVSGITDWGVFVELIDSKCEGMIRLADLEDDHYEYDSKNYRIIGRNNKRIINFGDKVTVNIKSTNLQDRTIDLSLVTHENRFDNL